MEKNTFGTIVTLSGLVLVFYALFKFNTTLGIVFLGVYLIYAGYLAKKTE